MVLHDIIVKEDKLLVNVHFYTIMRYELMKWKIIADSGCDYRSLDNLAPDTEFVSVPLTIQVGETIYTDDVPTQYRSDDGRDVCDYDCF